jgi:hypothetical protein
MSISQPDDWDRLYGELCVERLGAAEGDDPDSKVARRHGFGSRQAMYHRLRAEGFQLCEACGARTPDPLHCERHKERAEPSQKKRSDSHSAPSAGRRKAMKFGSRIFLPSAEEAIPLFEHTLSSLIKRLDELRGREEYLQSGRFVGQSEKDGKKHAWGARVAPSEPLTTLIAIEALVRGSVTNPFMIGLLDTLHPSELVEERKPFKGGTVTERRPDPTKVDLWQLQKQMDALRARAENVARLVRGQERIREGRKPGELSPRQHAAYPVIKQRAREGCTDEEIREEVNRRQDRHPLLEAAEPGAEDFTLEEISYLKSLDF